MRDVVLAADSASVELSSTNITYVAIVAVIALIALALAGKLIQTVLAAPAGTPSMQRIAAGIQEGASAYLNRQFKTLAVFVVLAVVLLFLLPVPGDDTGLRIGRSAFFIVGAVFSAFIGYVGMWLATRANVRVAAAANSSGGAPAMKIAFRTGGVVGFFTVGLGLLGAATVVLIYR
ncbi:MAG: sodium/proton-translocating pyrophosphatase, partial [Mycobacteriales bacterium]